VGQPVHRPVGYGHAQPVYMHGKVKHKKWKKKKKFKGFKKFKKFGKFKKWKW
jgi:hypothetical protein